jgi:hypothetical protein
MQNITSVDGLKNAIHVLETEQNGKGPTIKGTGIHCLRKLKTN